MKPALVVSGIGENVGDVPISDGTGGFSWTPGLVRLTWNGVYPTRPTGVAVEWVGPVDPGTAAVDGDTWIKNA